MVTWQEFRRVEPALAVRVQQLFDAGRHKTIATVRSDGSPRISGIECEFNDTDLTFGSMPGSRKGADLRRDPRFALHGPTFHPEEGNERAWPGEAKISGRAVVAPSPPSDGDAPPGDYFTADIYEVIITHLDDEATKLVIEHWSTKHGLRVTARD